MRGESISEQFAGQNRKIGEKVDRDLEFQKELDQTPWYKRHLFYWEDRRGVNSRLEKNQERYDALLRDVEKHADEIRSEADHYRKGLKEYDETQERLARVMETESNPVNANSYIEEADHIASQLEYRGLKNELGQEGRISEEIGRMLAVQDFFFPRAGDTVVNVRHPSADGSDTEAAMQKLHNILLGPEGPMVVWPHNRIPRLSMTHDLETALHKAESQERAHMLRIAVKLEGRYQAVEEFDRFVPIDDRIASVFQKAGEGFYDGGALLNPKPKEGERGKFVSSGNHAYRMEWEAKVFSREEARDQLKTKELVLKYIVLEKGNTVTKEVSLEDSDIERLKEKVTKALHDDYIYLSSDTEGIVVEMNGLEIPLEQFLGETEE